MAPTRGLWIDHLRCRLARRPPGRPLDDTRIVDTPSGRIHLREAGDGDTTVLLSPDPPLGLDDYAPVIERLARDHHVVAFEIPGFGWSRPAPTFDWSLEATAGLIGDVADATTRRPLVPALACVAGLAGRHFATTQPHRTAGYVALQTPDWAEVTRWLGRIDPRGTVRRPLAGPLSVWAASRRIGVGWYRYAEPDPVLRDRLVTSLRRRPRGGRLFCLAAVGRSLLRDDPFGGAPGAPSAVVWGDADRSHRGYDPEVIHEALGSSLLVHVPHGGHFPELSDPEAVARAVAHVVGAS